MISVLAIGRIRGLFADPGPDFPHFGLGRRVLYIRRDFAARAPAIFNALARLNFASASGAGNRGSGGDPSGQGLSHIGSDTGYWQGSAAALIERHAGIRITPFN